jgi:hypothetical protein
MKNRDYSVVMSIATPTFLRRLIDDAAIFPPGNAPLPVGVREHFAIRRDGRSDVVGPFIVDVDRLQAAALLAREMHSALDVSVVVREPSTVDQALRIVADQDSLDLVGLEVVLSSTGNALEHDLEDLSDTIAGLATPPAAWIELPWSISRDTWADDLAMVTNVGFALKIRTGGLTPQAFPSPQSLAEILCTAAELGLPFKCTAGLHSPVRHFDASTGAIHHGFLNLIIASVRARAGGSLSEVTAILGLEDAGILAQAMGMIPDDEMTSARELFRSYGSCSIDEPLSELAQLGLISPGAVR